MGTSYSLPQTPRVYRRRVNGSEPKRSGPQLGAVARLRLDYPQLRDLAICLRGQGSGGVVMHPPLTLRLHLDPGYRPLLVDGDAVCDGCGRLPVVAVRGLPRGRHAQRPADRCRRRAAHAGSVATLSPALASAATESVAALSRELGEDAAGPRSQARTGVTGSCSLPMPTPWRRARLARDSRRSASAPALCVRRTCRCGSHSPRRHRRSAAFRAEGGGPEARADSVVVAACLAEAAACGAAFVRLAGLLNDRGAKCANVVACARDRPLAR
jgi:hypothetical protein